MRLSYTYGKSTYQKLSMAVSFNKAFAIFKILLYFVQSHSKIVATPARNFKELEKLIELADPSSKCTLIFNTTKTIDLRSAPFSCVINVDDKVSMLTGGFKDGELKKSTWLFSSFDHQWSQGPEMIVARDFHACNSFVHNGDKILVVVGGSISRTIEFLNYDGSTNEWIQGPSLPEYYNHHFHRLVSYKDNIYYINTFDNVILLLECKEAIDDCQWILLEQEKFSRKNEFAHDGEIICVE